MISDKMASGKIKALNYTIMWTLALLIPIVAIIRIHDF